MRVRKLYIIALCERNDQAQEVANGADALFEKYKSRTAFRPKILHLIKIDCDSEAYKKGRQKGTNPVVLAGSITDETIFQTDPGEGDDLVTPGATVGVYLIAHGDGTMMSSNTKPQHVANVLWRLQIHRIDKLCVLACSMGRVSHTPQKGWNGYLVTLCEVLAKKAKKDVQSQYDGGAITPKVAGWDAIVSVLYADAQPSFTPQGSGPGDYGRKVVSGNSPAFGKDNAATLKHAFQYTDGGLQKLDLAGWSDKV